MGDQVPVEGDPGSTVVSQKLIAIYQRKNQLQSQKGTKIHSRILQKIEKMTKSGLKIQVKKCPNMKTKVFIIKQSQEMKIILTMEQVDVLVEELIKIKSNNKK